MVLSDKERERRVNRHPKPFTKGVNGRADREGRLSTDLGCLDNAGKWPKWGHEERFPHTRLNVG